MIIKANELRKYMELHNVDKIPVEVVNTEIPECKELRQGARKLAKRLIIISAQNRSTPGYGKKSPLEATYIHYVMYNSFKKSKCFIPPDWELEVLTGEVGEKILKEYADHGGNLEQKFRDAFAKHNPEIQAKIDQAAALLKEAEQISEKYGVPFYPNADIVDGLAKGYYPESCDTIFGELLEESDVVNDLTGVYKYGDYSGWQTSSGSC